MDTSYSFKNAFLLSISFAERELINCNFTGAVMDAVRTRGWKPDEQTLKNTKYIYTDYEAIKGVIDEETGREKTVYKPIEDSRVPASGFFGEGDHQNFTIAEYLKERYRWSRAVNLPAPIRTAVLNYIQFFTDFIQVTEGLDIELRTRQEGEKIRVEFLTETREDKEVIEKKFYEYLTKVQEADLENLDIKFSKKSKATQVQKNLLEIELKSQIRSLRDKLEYTGKLLESEKEKVGILRDVLKDRNLKPLLDSPPQQMKANFGFLKGDIVGFSGFEVDERTAITEKLESELEKTAEGCVYKKVIGGDSIEIINSDAQRLAKVAVRITEDVEDKFPKKTKMRIAVDFGELTYEQSGKTFLVKGGEPLRTAARIEPHVTPGQAWCTELFKNMLEQTEGRFYAQEIQASEAPHLEYKDGKFNVKKKGSPEPDFYQKLYRIRKK